MTEKISVQEHHWHKYHTLALLSKDTSEIIAQRETKALSNYRDYQLHLPVARKKHLDAVIRVINSARAGLLTCHNDGIPDLICYACKKSDCKVKTT